MRQMEKSFPLREEMIDENRCAESLLEQAMAVGLIAEDRFQEIRRQLYDLLNRQWTEISEGNSSSISMETAQKLTESIVYVIGITLKACPSLETAVRIMNSTPVEQMFDEGIQIIEQKMKALKRRHGRILNRLLETENVFYTSTLKDGMKAFFRLYRPSCDALDIHITLDYPLYAGRPQMQGIELVEQYLTFAEAENSFCTLFDAKRIHELLCGLSKDYVHTPLNLFEYVLMEAIGLVLCGGNPFDLNLKESDLNTLHDRFEQDGVRHCVIEAIRQLDGKGLFTKLTRQYVTMCQESTVSLIEQSLFMHTLHTLFLIPLKQEPKIRMEIQYGEGMNYKEYMRFLWTVRSMDSPQDTALYIILNVRGFNDLLDLFTDAQLDEEVMNHLVPSFPLPLFAWMYDRYGEELLCENMTERNLSRALQRRYEAMTEEELEEFERIETDDPEYTY